jgi:hypothetical protein
LDVEIPGGAATAGELYGRALVVIAAEQYASRLVPPASQRGHRSLWSSRRTWRPRRSASSPDRTCPPSVSALERAVKRAHAT